MIEKSFVKPGINDEGADDDPYTVMDPEVVLANLQGSTGGGEPQRQG